ncbi:hypothetical protein D3C71_577030 [compost metagenome]
MTSGGYIKYIIKGMMIKAINPGSNIASAHVLQLNEISLLVAFATKSTTNGLGAVAVMNIAEVIGLAW